MTITSQIVNQTYKFMPNVDRIYGNRVRVRACGICLMDNKLLLVNHRQLSKENFWAPPGGGIEFGELAGEALEREFLEETGLKIKCEELLFIAEFVNPPLHAVELFFKVDYIDGVLKKGFDPEMGPDDQLIEDAKFMSWKEILKLNEKELHGIFKYTPEPAKILDLRGYFKL